MLQGFPCGYVDIKSNTNNKSSATVIYDAVNYNSTGPIIMSNEINVMEQNIN